MWPSLEAAIRIFDWANLVFWLSLVVGVFAVAAIIWTSSVKEKYWDEERESTRLRVAQLESDTAQAIVRAAEANQKAEEERLARVKLETKILPRRIFMGDRNGDKEIRQARFMEVKKYAGTLALIQAVPDFEARTLASDIETALSISGWDTVIVDEEKSHIPSSVISAGVRVVTLEAPPVFPGSDRPVPSPIFSLAGHAAQAVVGLLSLDLGPPFGPQFFGVHWGPEYKGNDFPAILTRWGFKYPDGAVVILVGLRPLEY